jgi:hypothetical protein
MPENDDRKKKQNPQGNPDQARDNEGRFSE